MSLSLINALEFRPVDPVEDLDHAYWHFFKPGIEECVKELNDNVWPESRYDFFKKGFVDPDMMMISYHGANIGCYCISNQDNAVILQRVYIAPEYQRKGIGTKLIGMALEKAHELQKPLELEVLANNTPAINSYLKGGFVKTSGIIVNGWNQKFTMRHKDTIRYLAPKANQMFAQATNGSNDNITPRSDVPQYKPS